MLKRDQGVMLPTQVAAPGYKVELRGTAFCLVATGSWTVREATALDSGLQRLSVPIPPTPDFTGQVDISGIDQLDTAGAWLLQRTVRLWEERGLETHFVGATESFEILLDEVRARGDERSSETGSGGFFANLVRDWSKAMTSVTSDAVLITSFLGHLIVTLGRMIAQPWRFRPNSFIHHIDHAGFRAVPIIALICLLIGAVVMQQGVVQLQRFGAETFAVNMVGILSLREVGILLTAIMVAGRSGSAFTAEIGSMKMREEIDAMRTLGIDPMETLVAPRVLALIVALPLLTFVGNMMCLIGGGIMAKLMLGLDSATYIDALHGTVDMRHFMAGMIKAPFAALIIGLVGCLEGLKVSGSAESLGFHVTSAVVKAIFLVIVFDALFAMFLSAIGV
ncbi:MAG: ABC transporter permease [Hyphomicrobiaceae bacterium]|nr:ABC transporter permease [Hyphomicrobiaceae bacterium]